MSCPVRGATLRQQATISHFFQGQDMKANPSFKFARPTHGYFNTPRVLKSQQQFVIVIPRTNKNFYFQNLENSQKKHKNQCWKYRKPVAAAAVIHRD